MSPGAKHNTAPRVAQQGRSVAARVHEPNNRPSSRHVAEHLARDRDAAEPRAAVSRAKRRQSPAIPRSRARGTNSFTITF